MMRSGFKLRPVWECVWLCLCVFTTTLYGPCHGHGDVPPRDMTCLMKNTVPSDGSVVSCKTSALRLFRDAAAVESCVTQVHTTSWAAHNQWLIDVGESSSGPLSPVWVYSEGTFPPQSISCGLQRLPLGLHHSSPFPPPPFHWCWSQGHALINMLLLNSLRLLPREPKLQQPLKKWELDFPVTKVILCFAFPRDPPKCFRGSQPR